MSTTDVNAFLMSSGARSAKFEHIGAKISGTVVSAEVRQQTDIKTGQPKTWDNGDPMMQVVVALQTDERDHDDPDDDGIRNVYLKGGFKSSTTQRAVAEAIKAAGASALEVGATLQLAYVGDGEASQRGFNPPKQYAAKYTPPSAQPIYLADPFAD